MRVTQEQYKALLGHSLDYKESKYHSTKTEVNGIKFDSKKEAIRYQELKLLEKAGMIKDLELQKSYILQPKFIKNGKTYRPITYVADFVYYDLRLNKVVVEDTKGFRTDIYKIKKKMFEYIYKDLELKEI